MAKKQDDTKIQLIETVKKSKIVTLDGNDRTINQMIKSLDEYREAKKQAAKIEAEVKNYFSALFIELGASGVVLPNGRGVMAEIGSLTTVDKSLLDEETLAKVSRTTEYVTFAPKV